MRFKATDVFDYYKPSPCARRVSYIARGIEQEQRDDPFMDLLVRLGHEHEARHLAAFPGILDLSIFQDRPDERERRTLTAIAKGAPAIYQARFRQTVVLDGNRDGLGGVAAYDRPLRGDRIVDRQSECGGGQRLVRRQRFQEPEVARGFSVARGEYERHVRIAVGQRPGARKDAAGQRAEAAALHGGQEVEAGGALLSEGAVGVFGPVLPAARVLKSVRPTLPVRD